MSSLDRNSTGSGPQKRGTIKAHINWLREKKAGTIRTVRLRLNAERGAWPKASGAVFRSGCQSCQRDGPEHRLSQSCCSGYRAGRSGRAIRQCDAGRAAVAINLARVQELMAGAGKAIGQGRRTRLLRAGAAQAGATAPLATRSGSGSGSGNWPVAGRFTSPKGPVSPKKTYPLWLFGTSSAASVGLISGRTRAMAQQEPFKSGAFREKACTGSSIGCRWPQPRWLLRGQRQGAGPGHHQGLIKTRTKRSAPPAVSVLRLSDPAAWQPCHRRRVCFPSYQRLPAASLGRTRHEARGSGRNLFCLLAKLSYC